MASPVSYPVFHFPILPVAGASLELNSWQGHQDLEGTSQESFQMRVRMGCCLSLGKEEQGPPQGGVIFASKETDPSAQKRLYILGLLHLHLRKGAPEGQGHQTHPTLTSGPLSPWELASASPKDPKETGPATTLPSSVQTIGGSGGEQCLLPQVLAPTFEWPRKPFLPLHPGRHLDVPHPQARRHLEGMVSPSSQWV